MMRTRDQRLPSGSKEWLYFATPSRRPFICHFDNLPFLTCLIFVDSSKSLRDRKYKVVDDKWNNDDWSDRINAYRTFINFMDVCVFTHSGIFCFFLTFCSNDMYFISILNKHIILNRMKNFCTIVLNFGIVKLKIKSA